MHNRRSVFRDNPDPNDPVFFEKIMSVIQALAADGVHLELISDETSQMTHLHQITWQSVDEELQTELSIVRDLHDEVCYATIRSKQSWISKRARELFNTMIDCYTINELIELCSRRFFDSRLLICLGLLGRKPDADMIKTISTAIDHDLPRTRYCAARAAAITQWPAFLPDLEMMLKMETDPSAREMAEHALEVCSKTTSR
ncbi:MAG: HEAT repeat domain-containing protein [Proteobacteria bacterium]|nr:HEAT repeat domain-containing protein [Pseudomonadota bacterium]